MIIPDQTDGNSIIQSDRLRTQTSEMVIPIPAAKPAYSPPTIEKYYCYFVMAPSKLPAMFRLLKPKDYIERSSDTGNERK